MNDSRSPRDAETISPHTADTGSDPFDLVAEDFLERCPRGESPSISEYEVRPSPSMPARFASSSPRSR